MGRAWELSQLARTRPSFDTESKNPQPETHPQTHTGVKIMEKTPTSTLHSSIFSNPHTFIQTTLAVFSFYFSAIFRYTFIHLFADPLSLALNYIPLSGSIILLLFSFKRPWSSVWFACFCSDL